MTATRVLPLLLVCALAAPGRAAADWLVTPFVGTKIAGETTFTLTNSLNGQNGAGEKKPTLGGSAGWLGNGIFGVEAEFGLTPDFFGRGTQQLVTSSSVSTLTGNVMFAVPRSYTGDSLRPYTVAGVGLMHVGIQDLIALSRVNANLLALTFGGGAIGPVTPRASLRFELRYFRNLTGQSDAPVGGTRLSFWRASVGIAIKY